MSFEDDCRDLGADGAALAKRLVKRAAVARIGG